MHISAIEACGFRNLTGRVEFGPGLNVLWGPNAQGKTSVLESIYTLANTKSFRTAALRETVAFGSDDAIVRADVVRGGITRQVQLRVAGPRKELYLNGKRQSTVDYKANLDAVVFSFEEMSVVRGEPAERRRFLDRGVVGLRPAYLRTLADYSRILKQKNRLLREMLEAAETEPRRVSGLRDSLEAWNAQLVEVGTRIHRSRTRYVERLARVLTSNLFGERLDVRYVSSFEGKGDVENYAALFTERLALRFGAELAAGHALIGPHRDDLEVLVNGREVSRFGSAGQQRSALLILDLAQISVYYEVYEEYPVLLIDDIDAELDRDRIERLLVHLEGKAQTFVSTSKRDIAQGYANRAELFSVQAGRVARMPAEGTQGQPMSEREVVGE